LLGLRRASLANRGGEADGAGEDADAAFGGEDGEGGDFGSEMGEGGGGLIFLCECGGFELLEIGGGLLDGEGEALDFFLGGADGGRGGEGASEGAGG